MSQNSYQLEKLQVLADDRNFKQHQFEEALKELITHHQILLLAIKKCIRIGIGE